MKHKSLFNFLNAKKGTISNDLQPQLLGATRTVCKRLTIRLNQTPAPIAAESIPLKVEPNVPTIEVPLARVVKGSTPLVLVYKIITPETKIQLPLSDIKGELIIDWGDMSENDTDASLKHIYNDIGLYTVIVSAGSVESTTIGRFGSDFSITGIKHLVAVKSWGDFNIKSLKKAFASAKNLIKVPNNLPHGVMTLSGMFYDTDLFNQDISNWDVSNVTDMSCMFYCARSFNQSLRNWNITNVITIDGIFIGATAYDQDISQWLIKCKFTNMG